MTATSVPSSPAPGLVVFGDPKLHTDGNLHALSFAPDGALWSVEEPGMVRRWNAETGRQVCCYLVSDLEMLWQFSQDARYLASASDDTALWDAVSGEILAAFSGSSWVTALAFRTIPPFWRRAMMTVQCGAGTCAAGASSANTGSIGHP
jgi:WD40 repeat protein